MTGHDNSSVEAVAASLPPTSRSEAGRSDDWTIAVIMPTLGRAATTRKSIGRLARQTRPPDRVLVVGVTEADVAGLSEAGIKVEIHLAPRGSCSQRNHAIGLVEGDADLVLFMDDDFLPADDYLANAERLLRDHPDIVGACGRMIADGVGGPGIAFDDAVALLAADRPPTDRDTVLKPLRGLYGCNMVIRAAAMKGLRFDENLPLYGWQEDVDFSHRVGARGRLVKCADLSGVHMGEKAGRSSGKRLGYSQIANPIYLMRKRSIPRDLAWRLMRVNLASNLVRSVWPEPFIDRRGRVLGNLLALRDLATNRLDPRRILELD
ncbi:MAG TPA: glycosyltransferase [Caulobacteraceae bacterium]|jgi:GT2 family glycosyltransferase|nr:glycosyltransferase [Caulobacteraceae bacterium]